LGILTNKRLQPAALSYFWVLPAPVVARCVSIYCTPCAVLSRWYALPLRVGPRLNRRQRIQWLSRQPCMRT